MKKDSKSNELSEARVHSKVWNAVLSILHIGDIVSYEVINLVLLPHQQSAGHGWARNVYFRYDKESNRWVVKEVR